MSGIPYLNGCLNSEKIDVCAISDHQLRQYNLTFMDTVNEDYFAITSPAPEPRFQPERRLSSGGTAFLCHKRLSNHVSELILDCDRVTGIELMNKDKPSTFIFSVYLPPSNRSHDLYLHYIQVLQDLYSAYRPRGHVILLGDFNARICGHRYTNQLDRRGIILSNLVARNNLVPINMHDLCTGPVFTFQAYDGGPQSILDYIMIPEELHDLVYAAEVKDDNPLNVSDHHPVICSLLLPAPVVQQEESVYTRPAWNKPATKGTLTDYTTSVSNLLWPLPFPDVKCNEEEIDQFYLNIVQCLLKSAHEFVPKSKFCKNLKPFWKDKVKEHHDAMTRCRRCWIEHGRPRGMDQPLFREYKHLKDAFRNTLKEAAQKYEADEFNKLDAISDIDQKLFWTLLRRGRKTQQISCLNINGVQIREPKQICNAMADHLSEVSSNKSEAHYNSRFKMTIDSEVENIRSRIEETRADAGDLLTSTEEVYALCQSLKNNKAAGDDQITYEHLKYGGKYLARCLSELFNLILNSGYIPKKWKDGIIIPIFKGGDKSRMSPDSYRGVTLLPAIFKLFEIVLSKRLPEIIDSDTFPCDQQYGFQKGMSSLHTSFLVQETAFHYTERSDAVHAAFLDSSKAFDTVYQPGLLLKLNELRIPDPLWTLFDHIYSNMRSCVFTNSEKSYWFQLYRGVRQGSVLSAKLYLVYIDGLLKSLSASKKGAIILDVSVTAPTQADDITLMSPVRTNLQHMVSICEDYSAQWRFTFSPTKSRVMTFGRINTTKLEIMLYGKAIPTTRDIKHVGIMLDAEYNTWDRTLEACSKLRATTMTLLKSGLHIRGLNPLVSCKLIKSVCLPRALYGCELWGNVRRAEVLALERAQRAALKMAQGLPRSTRTDVCNALVGWRSLEAEIDKRKLLLWGQLCNQRAQFLPRKVLTTRLALYNHRCATTALGFIPDIHRILIKYNLEDVFSRFRTHGVVPNATSWKKTVVKAIEKKELETWRHRVSTDPDICHFQQIHPDVAPHIAWHVAKLYPELKEAAIFMVQLCAAWRPGKVTGVCELCESDYPDLLTHMICSCVETETVRDNLWCQIIDIGTVDLSVALHNKADRDLVSCLLSGRPPSKEDDATRLAYAKCVSLKSDLVAREKVSTGNRTRNALAEVFFYYGC